MNRNNFFIVGAQRSGSTYLLTLLDEHPGICMAKPVIPEPKYFINKSQYGVSANEYIELHFNNADHSSQLHGEKSTSYYEREESAHLISHLYPFSKIIFILRDPVERALSNYFFSVENGVEKRTIEDVFLDETKITTTYDSNISTNPFDYVGRGEYKKFIDLYLRYFKKEQLKILIFEELKGNLSMIQGLFKFLNVDETFIPNSLMLKINESTKKTHIPDEVRQRLKLYYKTTLPQLEDLLGRDLNVWK